jgi:predicted enzyme related to lactoylglutathione lyase
VGDWTWSELLARDPGAASQFYHTVVGYDQLPDTRPEATSNIILASGGYSRASVTTARDHPKSHAAWILFVRVDNVKETVALALKLGGRVLAAPSDTPTEYWRAVIADPAGGHIGVVELEQPKEQP